MKVLYLTVGERCTDGIIRTQVGHLLRALAVDNSVTWVVCVPAHRISECLRRSIGASLPGVRRIIVPVPVRNLWMTPRQAHGLARVCCRIVRLAIREDFDLVHARGYPAAELARRCSHSLNIPWVFDPRGLYPEEMHMAPVRVQEHQREWQEREAEYWTDSSAAIAVSETMADYFTREHGRRMVHVVPCHGGSGAGALCGGMDRGARAVYVGSLNSWTSSRDIAELYLRVASSTDSPLRLTVVTRIGHDSVLTELVEAGVDASAIEVISAVPEEIPGILSHAAIGLLPLEGNIRNRSAWPVKLSEYLMAGLPVAAWKSDCSWQSYANGVGALVPFERDSNAPSPWSPLDAATRVSIRQRAAGLVSLEANVDAVNRVWRQAVECYES